MDALEEAQIIRQPIHIAVMRISVDRHVDLFATRMGERDGLAELRVRKIAAERTQTEGLSAEVDGIRAVEDRHLHLFEER